MAFTKITGPGIHTLSNIMSHNVKSSGIITAVNGNLSGWLAVGSTASFGGDVSIGGTLTYDDVTYVESVGIVTAKGGLRVGAGGTIIHALSEDGGKIGINTTDASHLFTVFAQSPSSILARFKAANRNSNFDIHTDGSSHGQAYVRNNIGAVKVALNSNGDSYFIGGDVGIGTDNPGKHLDVYRNGLVNARIKGNVAGGLGAELILQNENAAANGYSEIQFQDAGTNVFSKIRGFNLTDGSNNGYMALYTASATEGLKERVRISDAGNVGIGTDNPTKLLELFGTDPTIKLMDSSGDAYALIEGDSADQGSIRFRADPLSAGGSTHIRFDTDGTEKLRITSGGDVGIGTNAPASNMNLHVLDQTDRCRVIFESGGNESSQLWLKNPARTWKISNFYDQNALTFTDDSDERLRITSDGRVGINTTIPESALEIMGNSTFGDAKITFNRAATVSDDGVIGELFFQNNTDSVALIAAKRESAADDAYIQFATQKTGTGLAERLRIKSTGEVHISDRNSSTTGEHFFQAGAFGIRMEDTGGYNRWNIERNYGGYKKDPVVHLSTQGLVGINTGNPAYTLDVVGDGGGSFSASSLGANGQLSIVGRNTSGGVSAISRLKSYPEGSSNQSHFAIETRNSSNTMVEALRINSSGLVGIGTTVLDTSATLSLCKMTGSSRIYMKSSSSSDCSIIFGAVDDAATGAIRYDHSDDTLRFSGHNNSQKLYIDANSVIVAGGTGKIHATRTQAKFGIDCETLNIFDGVNDPSNYGMVFYNDPTTDKANGIGFFNDDGQSCGGYIVHQDKGGSNIGDIIFATSEDANTPVERARIRSFGGLEIGPNPNVSALDGDGTGSGWTSHGMVLSTPAYVEYQYTWSGQSDYVITLTCGSYFHSEFTYVQHQTNGGTDMQNYARGKWANNHTNHTGYMYEFSGQGTNAAVTTTFTVSDQNDNGAVNLKSNFNSGSSSNGFYGGGTESQTTGTGSATGKFVIDETYNGSGLSASTRALIVRVYFGSFSISIA